MTRPLPLCATRWRLSAVLVLLAAGNFLTLGRSNDAAERLPSTTTTVNVNALSKAASSVPTSNPAASSVPTSTSAVSSVPTSGLAAWSDGTHLTGGVWNFEVNDAKRQRALLSGPKTNDISARKVIGSWRLIDVKDSESGTPSQIIKLYPSVTQPLVHVFLAQVVDTRGQELLVGLNVSKEGLTSIAAFPANSHDSTLFRFQMHDKNLISIHDFGGDRCARLQQEYVVFMKPDSGNCTLFSPIDHEDRLIDVDPLQLHKWATRIGETTKYISASLSDGAELRLADSINVESQFVTRRYFNKLVRNHANEYRAPIVTKGYFDLFHNYLYSSSFFNRNPLPKEQQFQVVPDPSGALKLGSVSGNATAYDPPTNQLLLARDLEDLTSNNYMFFSPNGSSCVQLDKVDASKLVMQQRGEDVNDGCLRFTPQKLNCTYLMSRPVIYEHSSYLTQHSMTADGSFNYTGVSACLMEIGGAWNPFAEEKNEWEYYWFDGRLHGAVPYFYVLGDGQYVRGGDWPWESHAFNYTCDSLDIRNYIQT